MTADNDKKLNSMNGDKAPYVHSAIGLNGSLLTNSFNLSFHTIVFSLADLKPIKELYFYVVQIRNPEKIASQFKCTSGQVLFKSF